MTSTASEPDSLEDALGDLVRDAQDSIDKGRTEPEANRGFDQGELVERADHISFVLMVPGCRLGETNIEVAGGTLKVGTRSVSIARKLHCRVDPASLEASCVNGVLCIRVAKVP